MPAKVLIYSATYAYRHEHIPIAIEILKKTGSTIDVVFESTEDQAFFTDKNLSQYDALLFLSTSGDVLDDAGKEAFQNYLNVGGNFIAIHNAAACLETCAFYEREVGAYFDYHPDLQRSTVNVIEPSHPSVSMLPERWTIDDEMYNFKSDPRAVGATVVLTADESSYTDDGVRKFNHGDPHPIAWFQDRGAGVTEDGAPGRSFFTGLGHPIEMWHNETFQQHVLGGISWTLSSKTTKAFNPAGKVGNHVA